MNERSHLTFTTVQRGEHDVPILQTRKGRQREVVSSAYSHTLGNGRARQGPRIRLQNWALPTTLAASWIFGSQHVIRLSLESTPHGDRRGADLGNWPQKACVLIRAGPTQRSAAGGTWQCGNRVRVTLRGGLVQRKGAAAGTESKTGFWWKGGLSRQGVTLLRGP